MGILTGVDKRPKTAIVDKGYQGVEVPGVRILRSGQKRGITKTLRAMIKRRSAVEPTIGHMKMDGRLARNPLKGALGDAIHAVMCGAGHNLRLILAALRLFCARLGVTIQEVIGLLAGQQRFPVAVFAWKLNCSGRTKDRLLIVPVMFQIGLVNDSGSFWLHLGHENVKIVPFRYMRIQKEVGLFHRLKEILQNLPICLVAVSHRWHPQHL